MIFLIQFKLLACMCQNVYCHAEKIRGQGQRPQTAMRLPEGMSKLRNKSHNSLIFIMRFCANADVPLQKWQVVPTKEVLV
jgi:hypothetical protein